MSHNNTIFFDVEPDDTVEYIKKKIDNMEGVPKEQQKLIFAGRRLDDNKKLYDYNIQNGDIVHLILVIRE